MSQRRVAGHMTVRLRSVEHRRPRQGVLGRSGSVHTTSRQRGCGYGALADGCDDVNMGPSDDRDTGVLFTRTAQFSIPSLPRLTRGPDQNLQSVWANETSGKRAADHSR